MLVLPDSVGVKAIMSPEAAVAVEEVVIKQNLERFLLVLTVSLSVATLPQVFTWARQIPYTLLLVITGLVLALVDVRLVNLSPELILSIFLPPLLFEAAWNLKWKTLKRDLLPIILFAVVGVMIAVAGIGLGLAQFSRLTLPIALLVGASLAATDPVSVIALFRELGVNERLKTLLEGESLFNDGVAVVAFTLLVGIPMGISEFALKDTVLEFFQVVGIGLGVGGLIGFGISYLTQRFDLPLVEQSLTLISAYGTYLVAEELGGSGVIGVVTTGLILGNFGSRIGMNPRTRLIVSEFWEFLAFFVNSIVFLLIGDQVNFRSLSGDVVVIGVTILFMLLARVVSTYGLGLFSNLITQPKISLKDQTVMWWGGLRGSVSIALALSVPEVVGERDEIVAVVFGVVLFTLLVQGLTVKPLLQSLGLTGDQPLKQQYKEMLARQVAMDRVLDYLEQIQGRPDVDQEFFDYQIALIKGEQSDLQIEMEQICAEYPSLRDFATEQLKDELLAVEANTYAEFVKTGQLNQELAPFLQDVLMKRES